MMAKVVKAVEEPAVASCDFTGRRRTSSRGSADRNELGSGLFIPLDSLIESAGGRTAMADLLIAPGRTDVWTCVDQSAEVAALGAAILARWADIEAAAVPLRISVPIPGGKLWLGSLLPIWKAGGCLEAIRAIVRRVEAPLASDLAYVGAALSVITESSPRTHSALPWDRTSGAARLLSAPPIRPLPLSERLAVARTWAVLAQRASGPERDLRLHAALVHAFDLLLAMRADPHTRISTEPSVSAGLSAAQITELVFAEVSRHELQELAAALAHGERLGLARAGFAELLGRLPDGFRGLAAAGSGGENASALDGITFNDVVMMPLSSPRSAGGAGQGKRSPASLAAA